MNKRTEVVMEFMNSYGLDILIVLIVFLSLAYFGIIPIDRPVSICSCKDIGMDFENSKTVNDIYYKVCSEKTDTSFNNLTSTGEIVIEERTFHLFACVDGELIKMEVKNKRKI